MHHFAKFPLSMHFSWIHSVPVSDDQERVFVAGRYSTEPVHWLVTSIRNSKS